MIDVKGKKVLVVGLGASGLAAAELLEREGAHVKVTESSDDSGIRDRLKRLMGKKIEYEISGHTVDFCRNADLVVTSPGIDFNSLPLSLARGKSMPVVGELELGYHFCRAPVVAVTGTNGKSTTTELIGGMFKAAGIKAAVCGNIGTPLSSVACGLDENSAAVVEVSSFQLETIKDFKARVAVLLNVSEDHYDRHGDLASYKAEKFKIFKNQDENDWAVMHSDFTGDEMLKELNGKIVYFGPEKGNMIGGIIDRSEIKLAGKHNIENISAAISAAKCMDIPPSAIKEGITAFKGLAHRFEKVGIFGGIEFIDDSKGTNIDATAKALSSLAGNVVLIAGGIDKGGDYSSILPLVRQKVKAIVAIGQAREKIAGAFSSAVTVMGEKDMENAVKRASSLAEAGDIVMLSPMCSSFDMFSSYKERGDVFQREVKKVAR